MNAKNTKKPEQARKGPRTIATHKPGPQPQDQDVKKQQEGVTHVANS